MTFLTAQLFQNLFEPAKFVETDADVDIIGFSKEQVIESFTQLADSACWTQEEKQIVVDAINEENELLMVYSIALGHIREVSSTAAA